MTSSMNFGCVKSSSSSVICEEVFDEGYQPSNEEIKDYAVKIGIDPEKEPYLLYIARDGLMQALPPDWQICYNDKYQAYYYFNRVSKASQWEHPLDDDFKSLVRKARKEKHLADDQSEDFSNESVNIDSGIKSLQGNEDLGEEADDSKAKYFENQKKMDSFQNRFLTPIGGQMGSKQLTPNRPLIQPRNFNSMPSNQIGLQIKTDSSNLNNKTPFFLDSNKDDKPRGFTLSGTGSMFLKSNTAKPAVQNLFADRKENNSFGDYSGNISTVKGILRDSSLGDVRTKLNHPDNHSLSFDSEDRKSVRFNFDDKKLNGLADKSSSDDDDDDDDEHDDESDDEWDIMEIKPEENYVTEIRLGLNATKNIVKTDQPKVIKTLTSFGKMESHDLIDTVKPLYDDESNTDSANSIKLAQNYENNVKLKEQFKIEEENEEKKLRDEMQKRLEKLKNEILEKNKTEAELYELEMLKSSNKEELENMIREETEKFVDIKREKLEILKIKHDEQLETAIKICEDKYEKDKLELEENHRKKVEQISKMFEHELQELKIELEIKNKTEIENLKEEIKLEFDSRRKEIVDSHRASVEILQKNHSEILEELERDLKTEEELLKKDHLLNLAQMKDKLAHELELERQRMRESGEDRLYEKIRCEKRLLEDKYRCLKEKYIRLKTDVKLSLERRNNRRKEQQSINTGSETEKSASNNHNRSTPISAPLDYGRPPVTPKLQTKFNNKISSNLHNIPSVPSALARETKKNEHNDGVTKDLAPNKFTNATFKYLKQIQNYDDTTSISQSDTTISNQFQKINFIGNLGDNGNSDSEAIKVARNFYNNNNNNFKENPGRQRKKIFTRMKSASTSRLNSSNKREQIERPCTPVENLRRQLQKLEDLEDQFPDNSLDTTYHLRYPFTDIISNNQKGSSELEFFKHRIHLERDSVRRAKESLRTQRTNFRAKQREIKQRHKNTTRHTLDQLIQEEKELTEMEVNLHRTRALLGEKVIRLRHLEQSLQRIYEKEKPDFIGTGNNGGGGGDGENIRSNNKDDATLSDLSSHSSSGFSSTDFATDTNQTNVNRKKENIYQESSEIIQSLENLNAEIREIWEILSKQQSHGLTPPPTIFYPDMNWGLTSITSSQGGGNSSLLQQSQHQQQPTVIPTLADRLETYRQIARGRGGNGTSSGLMSLPAANTIVSQPPLAQHYTTSLVERTRDLRNWLRQAKNEHELLSGTQQADL